jgi:hypothetical protein
VLLAPKGMILCKGMAMVGEAPKSKGYVIIRNINYGELTPTILPSMKKS